MSLNWTLNLISDNLDFTYLLFVKSFVLNAWRQAMSASSILFVLSEGSTLVCILPVPNEDYQLQDERGTIFPRLGYRGEHKQITDDKSVSGRRKQNGWLLNSWTVSRKWSKARLLVFVFRFNKPHRLILYDGSSWYFYGDFLEMKQHGTGDCVKTVHSSSRLLFHTKTE